jgi:EamA domain-containing membrane protein RarD
MNWLKTIWTETYGLFVDDVSLALAVLAWLAFCWALFHLGAAPGPWRGPLLFVGLAAIFVENTLRRARK